MIRQFLPFRWRGSELPASCLWVACKLPASYLRVTCELPASYLRVACELPAPSWLPVGFELVSSWPELIMPGIVTLKQLDLIVV